MTRLISRFSRPVPNGIDRVDVGYARHFLSPARQGQGILFGPIGLRAIDNLPAGRVVQGLAEHWREEATPDTDAAYRDIVAWLAPGRSLGSSHGEAAATSGGSRGGSAHDGYRGMLRTLRSAPGLGRAGLLPGRSVAGIPLGAVYLNVSQFPVWVDGYFRWLDRRPDVRPVFFLHDVLPLTYPEMFPPAEAKRHLARLDVLSRRAAGIIVALDDTKRQLTAQFTRLGRSPPPICVTPLPVDDAFHGTVEPDPALAEVPYFVTVGTLEPRKNHLMLLHAWRQLAQTGGPMPKLVLVGVRGWDNENVVDLLERCPSVVRWVHETGRLSTPALRRLLAGARALLMPSHGEGYGLPVAEALAAGVPVIASDIPAFREMCGAGATLLDPLDGPSWVDAIAERCRREPPNPCASNREGSPKVRSWMWHVNHIERFLAEL